MERSRDPEKEDLMKETMSPKERLLATLAHQPVDRIPVAQPLHTGTIELMKSCGAFWPEVHSNAELMATLSYEAHRVIGFESVRVPFDINIEAEAMGCTLEYHAGRNKGLDIQPPVKEPPMSETGDFSRVKDPDPYKDGRMPVVLEAIKLLKKRVPDTLPVLSMVVGPFMVAGQVRGVDPFMRELMRKPAAALELIERARKVCVRYAQAQVEAGADVVVIVDATASCDLISPKQFDEFAKPFSRSITESLSVPTILHICGKNDLLLTRMAEVAPGISVDSMVDMANAKQTVGENTAMFGNINVNGVLLFGEPEEVKQAVIECIEKGTDALTTCCGIPPQTSTINLQTMVETGKKYGFKKVWV
jgi:[methyl-Co(III) methanol-specific corrinoid protein]:coenzyme M methyltransferase